jgi:fatty-acyl-CoA synthase
MHNGPEFSFLLGAAALSGIAVVGLNPTRGADGVRADVRHTDCALVLTERAFADLLDRDEVPTHVIDDACDLAALPDAAIPEAGDQADLPFMLILTSGTTAAPKAVVCSQGKVATQGWRLAESRGLGPDDVLYCAMPLFHSNAVVAAWVPALASGGTLALRPKFSASAFLGDVRQVGATYANYVGKPLSYILATPERPDDAVNPLRQVFGNEAAPADAARFARRFGCAVIDAFGSTEGGISFVRHATTPPAALGIALGDVRVVGEDGTECPRAVFDTAGRLANAEEAVGELVNFDGAGAFEGYYANPEADRERMRDGRFWSGDLAYRDEEGHFYFAGRSGDWIRVGGENFAAAPVTRVVEAWPGAVLAVAYGVPDAAAGDQVMVAVEPHGAFDPVAFAAYLDGCDSLPPLWRPRYVRVVGSLPRTATHKVVVRTLVREAWATSDPVYVRDGGAYRPLTDRDRTLLVSEFEQRGRRAPGV